MLAPMRPTSVGWTAIVAVLAAAVLAQGCQSSQTRGLILTADLRQYGFPDLAKAQRVDDNTDLQFLSNDLLLTSINERHWNGPVEPLDTDQPPATFVLFDVNAKRIVKMTHYPVEKFDGSVRATIEGEFVVLNEAGIHVCSSSLACGRAFPSNGPVRVLPGGTKLVAGGNGQTEVDLLDSSTLQVLSQPAPSSLTMGLMDGIFLKGKGIISDSVVADGLISNSEEIRVQKLDGTSLYNIPVTSGFDTTLIPNRSGSRFCVLEQSYTRWNSIVNFWDIDNARPHNFGRVRVFNTDSGKQLFELSWDPRPSYFIPRPTISPDGHKLALIQHSELEVFDVP